MQQPFKYQGTHKYQADLDGDQYIFEFDNGYGASVVRNRFSYGNENGLWELAVLDHGQMTYKTPITDDVIGYLSVIEINDYLDQIKAL